MNGQDNEGRPSIESARGLPGPVVVPFERPAGASLSPDQEKMLGLLDAVRGEVLGGNVKALMMSAARVDGGAEATTIWYHVPADQIAQAWLAIARLRSGFEKAIGL
jgi:hypothetical protein